MTKKSMLLSIASGKLGDMVFYRAGGEQRTRTRVVPKNPKTIAQMNQRLRMLNPSAIYRSLPSILTASFTERKSNQSSANKFMSEAISTLPYYITKQMKEDSICVPFGVKLSSGSLGVRVEGQTKNVLPTMMGEPILAMAYECLFDGTIATPEGVDVYNGNVGGLPGSLTSSDKNAKYLRAALIPSVPDKFTISVVAGAPVLVDEDKEIYGWKIGVRTYSVDGDTLHITYKGCPEAEDYAHLHYVYSSKGGSQTVITAGAASANGIDVAQHPTAVILSFEQEGKLVVSTSYMSAVGATGTTPKRNFDRFYKEGGAIYVQAMNEYGFTTGSSLNGQALNTTEEPITGGDPEGGEDLDD